MKKLSILGFAMLILVCQSLYAQNVSVLSLDGDGDYVQVIDSPTLYTNTPFTLEAWFQFSSLHAELNSIIANDEYEVHVNDTGQILVWDVGSDIDMLGATLLQTGKWYHVAFVNDGTQRSVYLDGVLDAQLNDSLPFGDVPQNLFIGFDPFTNPRDFNGLIDEVRIWNVARSQADIQANRNQPLTGNEIGLVAYYRFDQLENLGVGGDGLVDDVRDFTGNGNHGDLVGDATLIPATDLTLPVELSAFTGTITQDGVMLKWRTESETNNLGFHIYRSKTKDRNYVRITPTLIKGHGTDAQPYNYSFLDDTAELGKTYYYYIEDIDFTGNKEKSHTIKARPPMAKGKLTTTWATIKKR